MCLLPSIHSFLQPSLYNNSFKYGSLAIPKEKIDQKNFFNFGHSNIPHPAKIKKGGEDYYFADEQILVVADGVGEWSEQGIDSGKYSKELCQNIKNKWDIKKSMYSDFPKQLLIDTAKESKQKGSSTCCIITINNENSKIYSSYIGDSGYILIRILQQEFQNKLQLIFESPEQIKSFNQPFQIGTNGDHPANAQFYEHEVQDGDLIICGSDGLFDNMNQQAIIQFLEPFFQINNKIIDCQFLSEILCREARDLSKNINFKSPFSQKAQNAMINHQGGKLDDITVLVAQINLNHQN